MELHDVSVFGRMKNTSYADVMCSGSSEVCVWRQELYSIYTLFVLFMFSSLYSSVTDGKWL